MDCFHKTMDGTSEYSNERRGIGGRGALVISAFAGGYGHVATQYVASP